MFLIIGAIPYAVVGVVLNKLGLNFTDWQALTIIGCMIFSDTVNLIKGALK